MAQQGLFLPPPMMIAPELRKILDLIQAKNYREAERLLNAASRAIKAGAPPPNGWNIVRPRAQAKINGWHNHLRVEREKREARKLCGSKTPAAKKQAKKKRGKKKSSAAAKDDKPAKKVAKKAVAKKKGKKKAAKKKASKKKG